MTNLKLTDVEKTYSGNINVLRDINLDIKTGELIVFVGPSGCGKSTLLRRQGYLEALSIADIGLDEQLMSQGAMTEFYGYETATAMLALDNPPTAIMASSYVVALGVQRAIANTGLLLGKDISVIIHDDELSFFHNHGDVPQFTATRSSVREAGEIAASMLLDIIAQPQKQPMSRLLEARLTIGAPICSHSRCAGLHEYDEIIRGRKAPDLCLEEPSSFTRLYQAPMPMDLSVRPSMQHDPLVF
jgi:energy-coupling factor transporter ATP-binding protein EcfA2